jgi:hypothetical protein
VDGPDAVAVDARGRRFVAGGTTLFRLDARGRSTPVASLGEFVPTEALVADGTGGFWLLDRRGRSIGRIDPGAAEPRVIWEGDSQRLISLVWDGRKLVAIEGRRREVVAIERGAITTLLARDGVRPEALAADTAGRIAVLDGKTGSVRFLRADGSLEPGSFAAPVEARPTAVGLGPEGELHFFDAAADWVVYR